MNAEMSLRLLIEKWLTPTLATPIRVTRFSRTPPSRRRYVRVDALRPEGPVTLFSSDTMTARGAYPRLMANARQYVLTQVPDDWDIGGGESQRTHPTNRREITMMDESNYLTLENIRELDVWTCAWYDAAVEAQFISASYHPDTATLDRLRSYFRVGLTAQEAAHACFGGRH
ncbi:hypothetical protein [Caballeronia sp. SEWSISQ10-4 2]|uniref:hypothetical protein n=1 Tax=Caballeronia sp. SEWSISQ10-4 2 TaxID=2937438 RepID=UPI003461B6A7